MKLHGLVALGVLLAGPAPLLADTPAATTQPAVVQSAWSSEAFHYSRNGPLIIELQTPSPQQLDFRNRPPQLAVNEAGPQAMKLEATPARVGEMTVYHLRFTSIHGDVVTALLCMPVNQAGPFPLAIAVHGIGSNKTQVAGQVAPALVKRGFAVLAVDMPLHGERPGDPRELLEKRDLFRTAALYRQAVINIREAIDVAEMIDQLDTTRGVALVGYSMGSWLNSVAGPADPRVRVMVLMVGGATDMGKIAGLLPQAAALDPVQAIAHFSGRPLLMLNARRDQVVTPEMGRRLYMAAAQPKRQIWYNSGHLLPEHAYEDAADWLAWVWRENITAPKN